MPALRTQSTNPLAAEAVAGFIAGAAVGYSLGSIGRQRRAQALDAARQAASTASSTAGQVAQSAKATVSQGADGDRSEDAQGSRGADAPNDETLADRVRSQAFRESGAPEGAVNVNVEAGIVYLRGELPDSDTISALVAATKAVDGVGKVENLLHTPDDPAPHKQETDDETRRRVKDAGGYAAP